MTESNYRSSLTQKLMETKAAYSTTSMGSSSSNQTSYQHGSTSRGMHQGALRPSSATRPPSALSLNAGHASAQDPYSPQTAPAHQTSRRTGDRPRSFVCFLCGAQFGSTSLLIHIAACKRKWAMAEEVKPPRERRALPRDPPELMDPLPMDPGGMDAFNSSMFMYFDQVSLVPCHSCGRTFRPEALERHAKVCDGKGVSGVRKNPPAPQQATPSRPPTSPAPSSAASRMKANTSSGTALRPSSSRQPPSGSSVGSRPSTARDGPNMLSKPRGYNCFLCGAQFGSTSLLIHIAACKRKWAMAEEVKPPRERRALPRDPPELMDPLPMDPNLIDHFNARMLDVWGTASLMTCSICRRSFRPDAFERHSKLCTHQTPGGPHGLPANVKAPTAPSAPQGPSSPITPKAYTCYLCGRGFGSNSLSIHLPQCLEKWYKTEELKAKHERREPPPPPPELDLPLPSDPWGIEEFNARMVEIYNSRSLARCPHCNRTMTDKALSHHSKACTAEHPMASASSRPPPTPPTPPTPPSRGGSRASPAPRHHAPADAYAEPEPPPPPPPSSSSLRLNPKPSTSFSSQKAAPMLSNETANDERLECSGCGRRFTETALATHSRICSKVFGGKKRKVFDSSKHRWAGTDNQILAVKAKREQGGQGGAGSSKNPSAQVKQFSRQQSFQPMPKWKQQSEELRAAMRAMRGVKEAQAQGRPLPPPPPSAPDPSLVPCPHCGRRFNEVAANRHIPACRNTINKPKFLKAGTGGAGLLVAPQSKPLPSRGSYY